MRLRTWIGAVLASLIVPGLIAAAVLLWSPGIPGPISGAHRITQGDLCDAEGACHAVTLPFRMPPGIAPGTARYSLHLAAEVPPRAGPPVPSALYLPNVNTARVISVGGTVVYRAEGNPLRLWNRPVQVDLPEIAPAGVPREITIELAAPAQQGIEVWPVYLGAAPPLRAAHDARLWRGIDSARFVQWAAVLLMVGHLAVYFASRQERGHLWLALASGLAIVFLAQFAGNAPPLSFARWTPIWMFSVFGYVALVMRFVFERLETDYPLLRRAVAIFIGLAVLGYVLVPERAALVYGLALTGGTVIVSLSVLSILWFHRARLGSWHFGVYFVCFSTAAALGVVETIATAAPFPVLPLHLFHFAPIFVSLAAVWLFLSQLIDSLRQLTARNVSLEALVSEKTAELERSFEALAAAREREAVERERARFLLDLHDGIGGQLTNTLAYIENTASGDETIRVALEDAMRDLALMLDCLETEDSIATLLGMLRTRLDSLLAENGLEFNWRVEGEPHLPQPGPSNNLSLLRIVQEAITNTIKHAGASVIEIYADETQVRISDNGRGFDPTAPGAGQNGHSNGGGHGILGMKRRAEQIGVAFSLETGPDGTRLVLSMPQGQQASPAG